MWPDDTGIFYCVVQGHLNEVQGRQASMEHVSEAVQGLGQNRSLTLVAQLHSRYASLLTFVKDTTKRLELEVEQYAQYVAARDRCSAWLDAATEQVTTGRQMTGDTALLQATLDKLQVTP